MIAMQTKEGRRIAGRFEQGADLLESLVATCQRHDIRTGEVRGIGYFDDARLARWDPAEGGFVTDEHGTGPAQALSLLGNISQSPEGLSIHLQTLLVLPDGTLRGGRLVGGVVRDVEFFLHSVDDFALLRTDDDGSGLSAWRQIVPASPLAADGPNLRSEFMPGRLASGHDEPDVELAVNDLLQHPRLGPCVVAQLPDEDRATLRLESGRLVELHLGLVRLERLREVDGRTEFKVHIRRRQ